MIARDVNAEILTNENEQLKKSLKEKAKEVNRLQIRVAELSKELQQTKVNINTLTKQKSTETVVSLNKIKK